MISANLNYILISLRTIKTAALHYFRMDYSYFNSKSRTKYERFRTGVASGYKKGVQFHILQ